MVSKKGKDGNKVVIRAGELVKEHGQLLRFTFFEDADVDVDDIRELFLKGRELMNDQPYYLLTDARNFLTATKEAREYAAKNLRESNILANAILTNSIPVILLVNFYIRINRPEVPSQMFKNETNAINWLNSLIGKEKL